MLELTRNYRAENDRLLRIITDSRIDKNGGLPDPLNKTFSVLATNHKLFNKPP